VKMEKDVLIGKAGHTELHCDIYHPAAGSEKRIALVHFHGGAFVAGSKNGSGIFSLVSHRRSSPTNRCSAVFIGAQVLFAAVNQSISKS